MKIEELYSGKIKNVSGTYRVHFLMKVKEYQGKPSQTVVVVELDHEHGMRSALLDLIGDEVGRFEKGDKIKVTDCFVKLIENTREGKPNIQPLIKKGYKGKYEKVD